MRLQTAHVRPGAPMTGPAYRVASEGEAPSSSKATAEGP